MKFIIDSVIMETMLKHYKDDEFEIISIYDKSNGLIVYEIEFHDDTTEYIHISYINGAYGVVVVEDFDINDHTKLC